MGCALLFLIMAGALIVLSLFSYSPLLGIIALVIGFLLLVKLGTTKEQKRAKKLNSRMMHLQKLKAQINDISTSESYTSDDFSNQIILDRLNKQIILLFSNRTKPFLYSYDQIKDVEIVEDTTTEVRNEERVNRIDLNIYTKEQDDTTKKHTILFLLAPFDQKENTYIPFAKTNDLYKHAKNEAEFWHKLLIEKINK